MDTFDALSPQYDRPCSFKEFKAWADLEEYTIYSVKGARNGLVLNATR